MSSHVTIHRARMRQGLAAAGVRRQDQLGRRVVNRARANVPVESGRLRSSITHIVTVGPSSSTLRVGSPLQHARYIHEGTGIYGPKKKKIVPVTAKALKFATPKAFGPMLAGAGRKPGGFVFAKSVKGIPPNPFLTDALKDELGTANVTVRPV